MKRWICSLILLLTGIVSGAAEEEITYPRKLSCQISVEETFEVVPRPGWTVYPQRELALRFWSLLIRGPEDRFSLQLNFFCDTKDLARFDTPEKMRRALRRTMAPLLPGALETLRKSPAALRTFAPRGRFGFAMRITDAKYANRTPPAEEWKFLTSGIFRCGRDSALLFTLMTNSIDDAEYAGLLDFVASLAIPRRLSGITLRPIGGNSGFLGLPGDATPPSRFVRAAFYRATAPQRATGFETVQQCFHLLNNFDVPIGIEHPEGECPDIPSATQWTSAGSVEI